MRKSNNLKIGVFVLIGLVMLLAALFALGVRSHLEPKSDFETYVTEDVEGLSVGSPVKLRGVPVGQVTRINFTWNDYPDGGKGYVVVEFEIKDSISPLPPGTERETGLLTEIRKGLRARIRAQGITGNSFVSLEYLDPAEHPALKVDWTPARHYIPSAPGLISQMLSSIEKSLRSIEKFDFQVLERSLHESLDSMGKVMKQLDAMQLSMIGTNVNELVSELRSTNVRLKEFVSETRDTIQGMNLDGLARSADGLFGRLTQLAGRLDTTLGNLDNAPVNSTLEGIRDAAGQLNEVLHELKQYPSGFIFGKPPQPARSVDRAR
jgi:phospholipid/cholesterol/gamma-HCH transport system substrate-binding protein